MGFGQSWSFAQTLIEGVVMDNLEGIPISGANVSINGATNGTFSRPDGSFILLIEQNLPVRVSITYVGYELKEIDITEPTDNLLISLVPGALVGQEIVVSASRKREKIQEAPSAMDVIQAADLKVDVVSNPFLSLRNMMGLDVSQTGINGGHITLRGRSAIFQTETFVIGDYRNLVLPGLGALAYGQQPIDPIDLDRIEVVRGPGSALYGPGVEAGIVHFLSKSPFDQQGTSISIGGGTRNAIQASLRQAGVTADGKLGYKITGYYRKSRDWEIDTTDAEEKAHFQTFQPAIVSSLSGEVLTREIPNYDVESYGFTGTLAFRPNTETVITAVGGWSVGKAMFRTAQGEGYTKAPRPFSQVRVQSGGWFGQAFWSYHDGRDGNSFLYRTGQTAITESHQVEGQLQYNFDTKNEKLNFIFGADYRLNTIDSKGTVHGRWENMDDYEILGLYSQLEWRLGAKVDLVGATRFDHFFALESSSLSPRLGLVIKPSPKHTIRATFNRAVGAPTTINLFADLPLANSGAFVSHLLGGADEVSFNQPYTSSFIPGVDKSKGIGVDLQPVYAVITSQLGQSGLIPADAMDYLISMKGQINGFSNGVLSQDPLSRSKLKLSTSEMYEIGYRGLFADKIGLEIDVYYNRRTNVLSAPIQASPLVFQPTLAQDLTTAIMNGLNLDDLADLGLTADAVVNMYAGFADALAVDQDSGAPNILGLVSADQASKTSVLPTLDLAYYNIREIDYLGIDFSLKYFVDDDLKIFGNLSWLSETLFEHVAVGEGDSNQTTDFSLNIPGLRLKFGIQKNPTYGLNYFLMIRYQDDWYSNTGLPWTGPVEDYILADIGGGYSFKNGMQFNVTVTNLMQEKYRAFYGAPKIGRQLIGKVYYHF